MAIPLDQTVNTGSGVLRVQVDENGDFLINGNKLGSVTEGDVVEFREGVSIVGGIIAETALKTARDLAAEAEE